MAHYYACKFGLNRLRIELAEIFAKRAIMGKLVIAMYRLRSIQ